MKSYWLHKHDKDKLIIFFCGWGNDYNPFRNISSRDFDLLFFYDYSNLDNEIEFGELEKKYSEIHLIAWSLGVFVSNLVCQGITFTSALAINGTIKAIDETYGISPSNYNGTLDNLDERNRDKFFRRMCIQREVISYFNENAPQRDVENQKKELAAIKELIENNQVKHCIFNRAIASTDDAIFSIENQLAFWYDTIGKNATFELKAPHFPFLMFNDFNDILNCGNRS